MPVLHLRETDLPHASATEFTHVIVSKIASVFCRFFQMPQWPGWTSFLEESDMVLSSLRPWMSLSRRLIGLYTRLCSGMRGVSEGRLGLFLFQFFRADGVPLSPERCNIYLANLATRIEAVSSDVGGQRESS